MAGFATGSAISRARADAQRTRTFVLVHGAWHGGWCWGRVAEELRGQGHRVTTPTLTGLGERAHLQSPSVDLETHIADIVAHIDNEELKDIVLVGHSYGGFVIRAVSGRRVPLISHIVYLDAFVPLDGETVASYAPPERARAIGDIIANDAGGTIPPPKAGAFGVTDKSEVVWVERHLTPHPARTYLQPIAVDPGADAIPTKSYVACMAPKLSVLDSTRERLRGQPGWAFREVEAGHDVMVTAPALVARTLLSLVG